MLTRRVGGASWTMGRRALLGGLAAAVLVGLDQGEAARHASRTRRRARKRGAAKARRQANRSTWNAYVAARERVASCRAVIGDEHPCYNAVYECCSRYASDDPVVRHDSYCLCLLLISCTSCPA